MAGAFSGHLIDAHNPGSPFDSSIATHGAMSFNPMMHGTPYAQQSFSLFNSQSSVGANDSISEETAKKIASLQVKLDQKLGPEYISQRPGPGGGPKLTYVEGWKIINLANEVFGFNGWSSSIVNLTTDFADYSEETRRYSVGVTAVMRVTLRDGVFHEDVGYGMLENSKSKGMALDKCKKEAVTDGLKRALRNFGNVLGNCLYDKTYASEIVKIKVDPPKLKKEDLHRRPEFDDVKPDISSLSASTPNSSISSNQNASRSSNSSRPPAQQPQQAKPRTFLPALAQPTASGSGSSSSTYNANNQRQSAMNTRSNLNGSNTTTTTPSYHPQQRTSTPQPQAQPQPERRVSFSDSRGTAPQQQQAASGSIMKPEPDFDDDDGFGMNDDEFLALADLGPPIGADDSDAGRPIDHEEGLLQLPEEEDDHDEGASMLPMEMTTSRSAQSTANANMSSTSTSRQELIAAALRSSSEGAGPSNEGQIRNNAPSRPAPGPPASSSTIGASPRSVTSTSTSTANSSSSSSNSMGPPPVPPQQNAPQNSRANSFAQQQHQRYMNQRQNTQNASSSAHTHNQNVNPNPSLSSSSAIGNVVKRASTPSIGGFHFPPGINPLSSLAPPSSVIGIKRPAETTSFRGGRPGMGLQQAVSGLGLEQGSGSQMGHRQVLGALDIGEGGDVKRIRR
ncbi:unnamed protein product [Cyclocybe aegerita]|uniref:Uncharacterized protein n=1 Tax=Cyclocybe aegerita TaxID=1973307 RepID=A0A8S0XWT6_CYCAE|nr:unnamed protein product [Cyclocybe aegerita]